MITYSQFSEDLKDLIDFEAGRQQHEEQKKTLIVATTKSKVERDTA